MERARRLFADGLIADSVREEAEKNHEMALNLQRAAHSNVAVNRAEVARAQAALERAETDLQNSTITSPMDGIVLSRDVEVGDAVSSILVMGSQATLVMTLGDVGSVYVRGKVDEADVGKVYLDQPARIVVESFKDKKFAGKVTKISPLGVEKDNVTTFEVRVSIDNPGGELKANMSANAEIIREEKKDVLLVPEGAVIYDKDKKTFLEVPDPKGENGQRRGGRHLRHHERREGRGDDGRGAQGGRPGGPAVAMAFRDLLRDTLRTLSAHKLRTALTMFGIAWGIISITLMVAAGEGLRVGQAQGGRAVREGHPDRARRPHQPAGGRRARRPPAVLGGGRRGLRAGAVARLPVRPAGAGPGQRAGAQPVQQRRAARERLLAALPGHPQHPGRRGSLPDLGGRGAGAPRGVPGQRRQEAALRQPARDGRDPAGRRLPVHVVGVMQHKEQDSSYDGRDISKVFIPFSTMLRDFPNQARLRRRSSVDRLLAQPRSVDQHDALQAAGARGARRAATTSTRGTRKPPASGTRSRRPQAFREMTDGMKYFLGAVGLATLLIGGIGVMNVMLVAVRERTREIGVRKAVGATRRSIVRQFFAETMIVVFLSGGLGLGVRVRPLRAREPACPCRRSSPASCPPGRRAVLAFLLLGTIAVLSALYPASRAASVDPIEALRTEVGG